MATHFQNIMKDLARGSYAPVYFLQGSEVYYIDTIINYIEKNALHTSEKSLNYRTYYGKEQNIRSIISHARCLPMVGNRQLIVVKEAQAMNDLQNAQGQKILLAYLKNANAKTVLVFAYKYKNIKGKPFLDGFKNTNNILFNTPRIYESQIPAWIKTYVAQQGYLISPEAIAMLQSLLGTNLCLLVNELQKMMIGLPPKGEIEADLVAQHVGMQRESNPFELQRMIGKRDIEKTFQILSCLLHHERKNPAILIVSVLTSFFLKLLQLHGVSRGTSQQQAVKLKIHPYFLKDYQVAMRKHTKSDIKHHLQVLHNADLQLKGITTNIKEHQVLKELVARLLHT